MADRSRPETRKCPVCGGHALRQTRRRTIRYKDKSLVIDQPAWWCSACGEGVLDAEDSAVADRAFADLKAEAEGVLPPAAVARIRKQLKLSQRKAGEVLGGGARAFQRYEAGTVTLSKPMSNLLLILERRPELLAMLAANRSGNDNANRARRKA